jgi:heme/copper-type cytochrome/quinol oxidase subunit 3
MLALPPAPTPTRPRSLLVATALGVAGAAALVGGLLAVYMQLRDSVGGGNTTTWLPSGVAIPGIATNIMLITMFGASVTAQWAVYAIARDNRRDTVAALVLTAIFGVAVINAQAFTYLQMGLDVSTEPYAVAVYTVTGTFLILVSVGMVFAGLGAFRSLGGRYSASRHEGISAMALYWHFLTVAFTAIWYFVYVVK